MTRTSSALPVRLKRPFSLPMSVRRPSALFSEAIVIPSRSSVGCSHNGQIGDYEAVRRDLAMVDPSYYNVRLGTTDSETIFLLLLSDGLTEEPLSAFSRTVGRVEEVMQSRGILAIDSRRNGWRIDLCRSLCQR